MPQKAKWIWCDKCQHHHWDVHSCVQALRGYAVAAQEALYESSEVTDLPKLKRIIELFGRALDWMELSHYKCDINSDKVCYAEQYGDGDARHHHILREGHKLLKEV